MRRPPPLNDPPAIPSRLNEAEKFSLKKSPVHSALARLAVRLESEGIPYAIAGDMALNLHGFERMTRNLDVLMTRRSLEEFTARCVGPGCVRASGGSQNSFRDTESNTPIEILVSGDSRRDGKLNPIVFPDPEGASSYKSGVRVLSLEKLIEMKLSSGLSAPDRLRDLADVQDLIRTLKLPLDMAERLDDSLREEYRKLWRTISPPLN